MVFFCFSSKDRHSIIEALLYHITNYGIPVWYDRKKMLLGDDRDYMNFIDGIGKSNYALVVMSPNAVMSTCVREEMLLIEEKHSLGTMHIFPVFYCIKVSDLSSEYKWLTKLVYKEIEPSIDVRGTCNHIICKYLSDQLTEATFHSFEEIESHTIVREKHPFIVKLSTDYHRIDNSNLNAKIALLYAGSQYVISSVDEARIPSFCRIGIERLFSETSLNLPIDLREVLIFERLFLLLVNGLIS